MKKSVHFNRSEIDLDSLRKLKDLFGKDGELDQDAFVEAFGEILGNNLTELQLTHLFMKIDANSDGSVDWDEFTNYMFLENQDVADDSEPGAKQEDDAGAQFFPATYDIFELNNGVKKFHKDQVAKVLYLDKTNQLLSASQDGMVRFWHPTTLVHQSGFHTGALQPNSAMAVRGTQTFERNWITDTCYMSRSNKLAVSSIDSGVALYDLQTESRKLVGRIPLERFRHAAPLCLGYHYEAASHRELLQIGDDGGAVYVYPLRERLWSFDNQGYERSSKRPLKVNGNHEDAGHDGDDGIGAGAGGTDAEDGDQDDDQEDAEEGAALRSVRGGASTVAGASKLSTSRIVFRRHTDHVTQVDYVGGLSSLVTCSLDATVNVFDLERARLKRTFTQHKKAVYSFTWCAGSKVIASSGLERHIVLWSPYSRRSVASLYGHTSSVIKVEVNDDNNQLLSLSSDNTVKIWDIRNHKCVQTIGIGMAASRAQQRESAGQPSVTCMTYVRKHKSLVAASNKLKIFPLRPPSETSLRTHNRPVVAALYNSNFHQVVSVDEQSNLRIWNVETGEVNSRFQLRTKRPDDSLDQGASRFAAAAAGNSTLTAAAAGLSTENSGFDGDENAANEPVDALEAAKEISLSMQEGDDANLLLQAGGGSDDGVTALCFDDGGRRVITGSHDGQNLRIWNFSNGCLLKTLLKVPEGSEGEADDDDMEETLGHHQSTPHAEVTQIVYVVNVLPRIPGHPTIRNKYIVSAGWDRRVYVWMDGMGASDGNEQGYCVRMPEKDEDLDKGHRDDITAVVYLPPDTVATGGHDGQVIFWCLSSGKVTRRFREHGAPGVESMQFIQRLNMLLIAESDGNILVLDVFSSQLSRLDIFAHFRRSQPRLATASVVSFCKDASNDILLAGDERGREQHFNAVASLQEKATFRKVPGAGEVWVKLDIDMIKSVEVCRTFTDPSGRVVQVHPKTVVGLVTITRHDEITNEIKGYDGLEATGCQEIAIPMLEFLKGNESGTWIREEDYTERIGRIYQDVDDSQAEPFKVLFIRCLREKREWLAVDTKLQNHRLGFATKTIAGLRPPRSISLYYQRLELIEHLESQEATQCAARAESDDAAEGQRGEGDDSLSYQSGSRKSDFSNKSRKSTASTQSKRSNKSDSFRGPPLNAADAERRAVAMLGKLQKSHVPRAPASVPSSIASRVQSPRTARRRLRLRGGVQETEKPAIDMRQRVHEIADIPMDFGQLRAALSIAGAINGDHDRSDGHQTHRRNFGHPSQTRR
ncbi:WD repeat-containing protein 64 [Hondaea fermentalgiana]|uniref:WD repeat-containing protein 64 n=1 Tax=Hondaea fermentalgiana TaxID=2315210 RepID=A0A2R5GN79_9STRA|nr:WD repeat-containing protein 64 [Hondaea fermentalgiana]|eukprot:GBG32362.1 WD repeat-containing protein 64 [Hondaea fermentalgiana]